MSDDEAVKVIVLEKRRDLFQVIYDRYVREVYFKCLRFSHEKTSAEDMALILMKYQE